MANEWRQANKAFVCPHSPAKNLRGQNYFAFSTTSISTGSQPAMSSADEIRRQKLLVHDDVFVRLGEDSF